MTYYIQDLIRHIIETKPKRLVFRRKSIEVFRLKKSGLQLSFNIFQ